MTRRDAGLSATVSQTKRSHISTIADELPRRASHRCPLPRERRDAPSLKARQE
jgi:hypothetical protein